MEVQVIKAFMFAGQRVEPGSIIDMPVADAAYVIGLKRAEPIIDADSQAVAVPEIKPSRRRKAQA